MMDQQQQTMRISKPDCVQHASSFRIKTACESRVVRCIGSWTVKDSQTFFGLHSAAGRNVQVVVAVHSQSQRSMRVYQELQQSQQFHLPDLSGSLKQHGLMKLSEGAS